MSCFLVVNFFFVFVVVVVAQGCPKVVHGLMLECWEADKNKRPKFAEIVRRLDELFRFPEVLNDDLLAVKAT